MLLRDEGVTPSSTRRLVLAGVIAPVALTAGVVVAGLTWPTYQHRTQNISDLGGTAAPYPLVLNATLVLFGLLVVAFSVSLRRRPDAGVPSRTGALLVGSFGVLAVVQGAAPCTPGCAEGTTADVLHAFAATTGLLAAAAGMLCAWRVDRAAARPSWHGTLSAWTGSLTVILLVAWLIAANVDPDALHAGVVQRVLMAVVLVWLVATAARMRGSQTPTTIRRRRAPRT